MVTKFVYYTLVLLEGFGMGSFFPIYSPWLEFHGLNFFKMGTMNFFYHIAASILDPFTGYFADRMGKRLSFVVGQFFWTSTQYIYGASSNVGGFLLAEGVAAIGHSLKSDALESWLQNKLGKVESGKVIGNSRILFTLGQITTSIISGFLSFEYGMRAAWTMSAICFLVATILGGIGLYLAGPDLDYESTKATDKTQLPSLLSIIGFAWSNKTIRLGAVVVFVFNFCGKSVFMYWPQVVQSLGMSKELLGYVILAISIPGMVGGLLAGHSIFFPQNRVGLKRMLIIFGIGLFSVALAQNLLVYLIGLVIIEVAYGSAGILMYGHLFDEIDATHRSTVSSLVSSIRTLGGACSLLVMGMIADSFNPQATYLVAGVIILLFVVAYSKQK